MSIPALKLTTGGTAVQLTSVHVGSSDLTESLNRERAGVVHSRYGVPVASRTWKNGKMWRLNVNSASQSHMETLRDFFEAGSFYLYPDYTNEALYYTVYWIEEEFVPTYLAPDKYSLQATFKETTIGAGTPVFIETSGDQTIGGNLSVNGNLTVAGTINVNTFDTIRSNGDIYVNYDGAEGDSNLYFYNNSTPTGSSLSWNESSTSHRFSSSLGVLGTNLNLGIGKTSAIIDFCDGDGSLLYAKSLGTLIADCNISISNGSEFVGTAKFYSPIMATTINATENISASTFETVAGAARGIIVRDSNIVIRPSTNFGSACGLMFEDTGGTAIHQIGTYINASGSSANVNYGFLGYGTNPLANTYMKWYTSGITNEGRLEISAPEFVVTPKIQANGGISASTYSGITLVKGITIPDTRGNENIPMFYTSRAINFTKTATVLAGTSPSVTWQLKYGTDASAAGTLINSGTSTSTSTGDIDTTMVSASVAANNWIWFTTTETGGTVTRFHLSTEYKEV